MENKTENPFAWNETIQKLLIEGASSQDKVQTGYVGTSITKKWCYYIFLLEQDGKNYDNYIEAVGADDGSFWIGDDFSVAKPFDTAEELHEWAHEHGLADGQYSVRGFYT